MKQQHYGIDCEVSTIRPLNIVLVNTHRFFNITGGVEKVFSKMANALSRKGHRVTAVCYDKNEGKPCFPIDDSVTLINAYKEKAPFFFQLVSKNFLVNLCSLHWDDQKRRQRRITIRSKTISRCMMHKIGSALLGRPIDVLVSFQPETTYILKLLYGEAIPIVSMFHGHVDMYPELKVFGPYVERSDVIQVLRPEYVPDILSLMPHAKRVEVIGNAVVQSAEYADRSSKVIICVARISAEKRTHLLAEAYALLRDKFPDWKVQIWGRHQSTAYTKVVKSTIEKLHLESHVKLCGVTDQIDKELKNASIFALPSRAEGLPLSLIEAMTYGLPSIGCKDCPAVNSLIRDGANGFLCEDTPESLAKGLSELMSNEELRVQLGNQAKQDMKAFAPDEIWGQWERLLSSVVDAKKLTAN